MRLSTVDRQLGKQTVLLTIFKLKKDERQEFFYEEVGREHQGS